MNPSYLQQKKKKKTNNNKFKHMLLEIKESMWHVRKKLHDETPTIY